MRSAAESLVDALRTERSLDPVDRKTGASDSDLDSAIEAVADGGRDRLNSLSRSVVDSWNLTASLSDRVVGYVKRQVSACHCLERRRLDGDDARHYADNHLLLIERGRDSTGAEDFVCEQTRTSWVLDFPLRSWAEDHRGRPRLRRLPLADDEPPIGALN